MSSNDSSQQLPGPDPPIDPPTDPNGRGTSTSIMKEDSALSKSDHTASTSAVGSNTLPSSSSSSNTPDSASSSSSSSASASLSRTTSSSSSTLTTSASASNVSAGTSTTPAAPPVGSSHKVRPEDFEFGCILGQGAFATVYEVVQTATRNKFAIKTVDKAFIKKHNKVDAVIKERNVLQHLYGHPGVVKLYFTFQDKYSLYYVLELAQGGELHDQLHHLGTLPLETVRFYAAELFDIIAFMHSRRVIHRDIKPSNILLSESGHIKLTDFGTAKILPELADIVTPTPIAAAVAVTSESNLTSASSSSSSSSSASPAASSPVDSDQLSLSSSPSPTNATTTTSSSSSDVGITSTSAPDSSSSSTSTSTSSSSSATFTSTPQAATCTATTDEWDRKREDHRERVNSFVGTAAYVPPELLNDEPVTQAADWWAFGVVLYECLMGHVPFRGESEYQTFQAILHNDLVFPNDFDPDAKDLISKLLDRDLSRRWGVRPSDVALIRSHQFFSSIDFSSSKALFARKAPSYFEFPRNAPDETSAVHNAVVGVGAVGAKSAAVNNSKGGAGAEESKNNATSRSSSSSSSSTSSSSSAAANGGKQGSTSPLPAPAPAVTPGQAAHGAKPDSSFVLDRWTPFLLPTERILCAGKVVKSGKWSKTFFAKSRMLLLTSFPRFVYIDAVKMVLKGEIPWGPDIWAERLDTTHFNIHTKSRTYFIEVESSPLFPIPPTSSSSSISSHSSTAVSGVVTATDSNSSNGSNGSNGFARSNCSDGAADWTEAIRLVRVRETAAQRQGAT